MWPAVRLRDSASRTVERSVARLQASGQPGWGGRGAASWRGRSARLARLAGPRLFGFSPMLTVPASANSVGAAVASPAVREGVGRVRLDALQADSGWRLSYRRAD